MLLLADIFAKLSSSFCQLIHFPLGLRKRRLEVGSVFRTNEVDKLAKLSVLDGFISLHYVGAWLKPCFFKIIVQRINQAFQVYWS